MFTRPLLGTTVSTLALALVTASSGSLAQDTDWMPEARKAALQVPPKLVAKLTQAIDQSGHDSAITQCRDEAPKMAKAASEQSGWQIRRVSLRQRNPKAVPDAWERAVLEDFDRRAAAGESPATLEKAEWVQEGDQKVQRYMRALPVQNLCLGCHGEPANLNAAAVARLKELYPDDRAVGYKVGDLRGAMTLRRVP